MPRKTTKKVSKKRVKAAVDLIEQVRSSLLEPGRKVIRLNMNINPYFEPKFVQKCIEEAERLPLLAAMGEHPTPLQKLAIYLLFDSAHIQIEKPE